MDKSAFEADGVFLVARVKWHTDFAGTIESGLFKMMAIGLESSPEHSNITRSLTKSAWSR